MENGTFRVSYTDLDTNCITTIVRELTLPALFGIASKHVVSTPDRCHCWSLVIATRVEVGGCPAIASSSVQQGTIEQGTQ